jgi:hypothetical protein
MLGSIKALLQISHIPCMVAGNLVSLSTALTVRSGIVAAALLPGFSGKIAVAGDDGDDLRAWWQGTWSACPQH